MIQAGFLVDFLRYAMIFVLGGLSILMLLFALAFLVFHFIDIWKSARRIRRNMKK